MAKYWLFRLAAALVPHIPYWLARPATGLIAVVVWACAGGTRRRAQANLRRVPSLTCDARALRRAVRGVFLTSALNYLDFLRGPVIGDETLRASWDIADYDVLEAALAKGRGVLCLSGHFGNFESGASRLGIVGHRAYVPVEHIQPERLFELVTRLRSHHGVAVLPADSRETLRAMIAGLKRNGILMVLTDRHVGGASVEMPFFGEPLRLPVGSVGLALRAGAPVLTIFCRRLPRGRTHAWLSLVEDGPNGHDHDRAEGSVGRPTAAVSREREMAVLREFLAQLERHVANFPDQWTSALAPVWESTGVLTP